VKLWKRLRRRTQRAAQPGPQGEAYEALKMARRAEEERRAFANRLVEKGGRREHPFLDDPYT
jgi:hypothetical protein